MMRTRILQAVLLFALMAGTLIAAEPADLVLTGGKIVTLDAQQRVVEALAVRDGKLVVTGSNADVQPLIGPKTEIIRLDGKAVLPGFTQWPAYLSFDESKLGTLEVGKLADLVVLDRDYLACPDDELAKLTVERTVVGGRTVFRK